MSLAGLLTSSIGYFKLRGLIDKAVVDNAVFRLHYRFTCGLFFVGCALVSSMYLFGQPINCIDNILNGNSKSKEKAITTFCWISHTHTIPLPYNETSWDAQVHPGVGPGQDDGAYDEHRHVHSYYQWVPFALFLQGTMFFVPHWLWKRFEGGMIQQMTDGSRGFKLPNAITTQGRGRGHCDVLCDYLIKTLRTRGTLVFVYVFCEFLNLVNTAGHIFLTNRFLGGVFLDYGPTVFQLSDMDQTERRDPLIVVSLIQQSMQNLLSKHDVCRCSHEWPSARSTNTVHRVALRGGTPCAFYHSTSSTKRFTFFYGSGLCAWRFCRRWPCCTEWSCSDRLSSESLYCAGWHRPPIVK